MKHGVILSGAPDRSRTCDLRLRRPTLYPTELRALDRLHFGALILAARGAIALCYIGFYQENHSV